MPDKNRRTVYDNPLGPTIRNIVYSIKDNEVPKAFCSSAESPTRQKNNNNSANNEILKGDIYYENERPS